jgi:hypothetical protein
LSGVLTVLTSRAVSARGLRVELALREQVHHGPWIGDDPAHNPAYQDKEEETTVASTAVAAHSDFLTEQPRRFPFRISVPKELPAPSMQTPEFTVTWILRAVLDRALRHDPYVEIEMHGTTTPHRTAPHRPR